jgi:hypothetical protein
LLTGVPRELKPKEEPLWPA